MFKALFIILNLFSQMNFRIIKEEVNSKENLIYNDDYYSIYQEETNKVLKKNNDEWFRDLTISDDYKIFLVEKDLYIFFYENKELKLVTYDLSGSKVKEEVILKNELLNFNIAYNNSFYLIGSIKEKEDAIFINNDKSYLGGVDSFILKLDFNNFSFYIDKIALYGGSKNETAHDICFSDEFIYIAGKKDNLASGDLGNGGASDNISYIVKFNYNFEILDTFVINDLSEIIKLEYYKDFLYLSSKEGVYKISPNFEVVISNKYLSDIIYFKIASFNKIIVVTKTDVYVYDLLNLKLITNFKIFEDINEEIKELLSLNKTIIIKTNKEYYLDIADLSSLKYLKVIQNGYDEVLELNTIFGKAIYLEELTEPLFDKLIHGKYLRLLKYQNTFGTNFVIDYESTVPIEVNVTDCGIYPLGYYLKFTGRASLNNKTIANNYAITEAGSYTLKLENNLGEIETFIFNIDSNQVSFSEDFILKYNKVIKSGEVFYLEIKYNEKIENIASVEINNNLFYDLIINEVTKTINVKMKPELVGIHYYDVEKINYLENGILRSIYLNDIYVVRVLEEEASLSVENIDNFKYRFTLSDKNTMRCFEVSYYFDNEEYIERFALSSRNINLNNIYNKDITKVIFSLVYDLGDRNYSKIDLLEIAYNNLTSSNILEIEVLKKTLSLEEFDVILSNNKKVNKITINNELIYQKTDKSYLVNYVVGVALFALSFGSLYLYRGKIKSKKIKVYKSN